mgnify:CR=1 FL=1
MKKEKRNLTDPLARVREAIREYGLALSMKRKKLPRLVAALVAPLEEWQASSRRADAAPASTTDPAPATSPDEVDGPEVGVADGG